MSTYIESIEPVEGAPGLFRVTRVTPYCEREIREVTEECFTVHDEEGLEALPEGSRLIDFEDEGAKAGYDWLLGFEGWQYAEAGRRYRGSTPWSAWALENTYYGPYAIVTPLLLGEFFPEYGEPEREPVEETENYTGYRAVLHHRGGSRAGEWHGFPVEITDWPDSGEECWVKPLKPRPDGFGWTWFLWGKDRLNVGAKATERAA